MKIKIVKITILINISFRQKEIFCIPWRNDEEEKSNISFLNILSAICFPTFAFSLEKIFRYLFLLQNACWNAHCTGFIHGMREKLYNEAMKMKKIRKRKLNLFKLELIFLLNLLL